VTNSFLVGFMEVTNNAWLDGLVFFFLCGHRHLWLGFSLLILPYKDFILLAYAIR
jgi:hypothetical protein